VFYCLPYVAFSSSGPSDDSILQGLARVSHRPKLRFSTVSKYEYDTHGGEGVDVYVIDTGKTGP